jgi:hypothetical protein
VLLILISCGDNQRPQLGLQGRALWVQPEDTPGLDRISEGGLAEAGIDEVFVDAGFLAPDGTLEASQLPALSRGDLPLQLVLRGRLLSSTPENWGESLAAQVRGLRLDLANRGRTVVGVLLRLDGLTFDDDTKEHLESLRRHLESDVALGIWLPDSVAASVAAEQADRLYDYVVVELYGQPWNEADEPVRWELSRALPRVEELAQAGVAVRTLIRGRGRLVSANGVQLDAELSHEQIRQVAATVEATFQLEGYDRQIFSFAAPTGFLLGELGPLPRAAQLNLWRPTVQHVARAVDAVEGLALRMPGRGPAVLFGDLAPEGSALGVPFEPLLEALREGPKPPVIVLDVERGGTGLVIGLENLGGPTGVGQLRHNFVQLEVEGGQVARVDPGSFARYSLGGATPQSRREMRLGSARILRLAVPLLEEATALRSGRIVVRGAQAKLRVTALFVDPLGNLIEGTPWTWPPRPEATP